MFNDSSDFRHERLERLIWIDGNFVDFLGLALLMSYSKTSSLFSAKRKDVAGLTSCIFHRKYQATHMLDVSAMFPETTVLEMQWKNEKNRNHLQISLYKVRWNICSCMWYELLWWDVENNIRVFCVSDHIITHPTKSHILPTPSHPIAVSEAHKKRREAKAKAGMDWGPVVWDSKGALK